MSDKSVSLILDGNKSVENFCVRRQFAHSVAFTTTTIIITAIKKKAIRETQTLRAGCSKAEPNIFAPPQTPFPGVQDGQNLISWRWSLP